MEYISPNDQCYVPLLWIWTAIAGATFGALFIAYMRNTRAAVWVYGKWDAMIDSLEIDTVGFVKPKTQVHGEKFTHN